MKLSETGFDILYFLIEIALLGVIPLLGYFKFIGFGVVFISLIIGVFIVPLLYMLFGTMYFGMRFDQGSGYG